MRWAIRTVIWKIIGKLFTVIHNLVVALFGSGATMPRIVKTGSLAMVATLVKLRMMAISVWMAWFRLIAFHTAI